VRKTTRKSWAVAAGVAGIALLATACSSGDGDSGTSPTSGSTGSTEKVTLKIQTFNEFGYKDLYTEYMKLHPNVTIVDDKADKSDTARANVQTAIATGTVTEDIVAADVDWMPELVDHSDFFADLSSIGGDRWPSWKTGQATDDAGKLIGAGTDSGPEAVCYRKDLFEKAGLPTDREAVAQLLGTWDDYFATGKKFIDSAAGKAGAAWFDSIGALSQGMINQLKAPFEDPSTQKITVLDADSPAKAVYDQLTSADVLAQSAHLGQWSDPWNKAFTNDVKGAWATQLCPPWMTQIISGAAPDQKNWDIAPVMPGGASNWGGSFLLVPKDGKHVQAATDLVNWLTDPAQQAKVFVQYGNFPSAVKATTDATVVAKTDTYFGNAPSGKIFSDRFAQVAFQPFRGPNYFPINDALGKAYTRVDVDKTDDAASSWKKFETDVNNLS
jgi:cellobiose transport system substrate-binding protein